MGMMVVRYLLAKTHELMPYIFGEAMFKYALEEGKEDLKKLTAEIMNSCLKKESFKDEIADGEKEVEEAGAGEEEYHQTKSTPYSRNIGGEISGSVIADLKNCPSEILDSSDIQCQIMSSDIDIPVMSDNTFFHLKHYKKKGFDCEQYLLEHANLVFKIDVQDAYFVQMPILYTNPTIMIWNMYFNTILIEFLEKFFSCQ
ncbi:hypothetical protein DAPPUDRAFT_336759 [Daphnia pulex]|uniref:Uncharacterized protein n=1 Tax=Daphnia pulex TaxID=6669 RepID=E9I0A2_DAPPU|nr:hypothetical protein DAPPUDRAFT_336759 [Daphnia pulex]|eukprot:EFX62578.1 hypothetical protein DAPPUDRAFT_336759 [Daphnia pulex]